MTAHIVLFSPRPDLSADQLRSFARLLGDACKNIPSISRCIVGKAADVDAGYARHFGDKTYDFAAVFEFSSQDDLVLYLNHPIHEQLGKAFWEHCASAVIMEVEYTSGTDPDLETFLSGQSDSVL